MQSDKLTQLKNYRKVLYIIDMVKGFVEKGAMADPYIAHTIPEQLKLIEKFQKEQQALAFVKDNHTEDCVEFKYFPPHCIIGTEEADLVDDYQKYEPESLIYPKNSTSAIFAPNVITDLNAMENLEEIVVGGCCTDICDLNFLIPLKNYLNQINCDIPVIAIKSAMETYNAPTHNREYYNKIAYDLMQQAGIIVLEDYKEYEEKEKEILLKK